MQQSVAVSAYPNVTVFVACHAVDGVIYADARQAELVANGGVPFIGVLVIDEECALSVEPDVLVLIRVCLQRLGASQVALGHVVGLPDGVLLVHDVAAYNPSVIIDQDGTVRAFADGADGSLWNALRGVGVAELVEQLLLHVVGHNTLVGNRCPQVLMAVDIHDVGFALNVHAAEHLLHVAFEILRLRVIDTIARGRLNPECAVQRLLNVEHVAVSQRCSVLGIALVALEHIAVIAVESGRCS